MKPLKCKPRLINGDPRTRDSDRQANDNVQFERAAKGVSLYEANEILVFVFMNDEPDVTRYLMLQHSLSPQEQDIKLGLDGLYIERDDQKYGCYAGVRTIRHIDDRIEIYLTERGIQKLGVDNIIITPIPWMSIVDRGLSRLEALSQGEYDVHLNKRPAARAKG